MTALDRRRHAVRPDLADARLRGQVDAPRFAEPTLFRVTADIAPCRRSPTDHRLETEFLHGEPVHVFETANGWCWAQSAVDGYVGYVPAYALGPAAPEPTHRVSVPLALVFPEPSIKAPPVRRLPLNALLASEGEVAAGTERFHLAAGGYILVQHLSPHGEFGADWVAVAETFVGAPYLWGGKSWHGIDCSGLVQLAVEAAGGTCPRDSDMQAEELGEALPAGTKRFARGDLVFWKGHVGIMLDATRLLHANGYHHRTAVEPVAGTLTRLAAHDLPPIAMRRLPSVPVAQPAAA